MIALLKLIPLRFWIYGAIAAAFGVLLWRDHIVTAQRNRAIERADTLESRLNAEKESTRKANHASETYQRRLSSSRRGRGDNPFGAVWVCNNPRVRPAQTTAGSDAATPSNDAGQAEADSEPRNVGPELDEYGQQCEENMIQVEELQNYLRKLAEG